MQQGQIDSILSNPVARKGSRIETMGPLPFSPSLGSPIQRPQISADKSSARGTDCTPDRYRNNVNGHPALGLGTLYLNAGFRPPE